ncbi:fimbria/pilus outer membrane usher protein [Providencia alcalifaciens]|nr:fimbria/pilus outer membrane usher protein [Providencia alcalifaciens]
MFFSMSFSSYGDEYFDPNALELGGEQNLGDIDLNIFNNSNKLLPGTYRVAVYLNGNMVEMRDIPFVLGPNAELIPQLTTEDYFKLGVKVNDYSDLKNIPNGNFVGDIGKYIPLATTNLNVKKLQLDISIPQAAIDHQAQGRVDSKLWDQGVSAALLNYSMTGGNTEYKGGGGSNYFFLSLQSGLNFGAWRLRNYSTYNRTSNRHDTDESSVLNRSGTSYGAISHWDNINTYLQRDIQSLRGQLTFGDSYTSSEIFNSFQFRGAQLASDENMIPDSMRGFAPTIRGIARSNAKVTIRQNGYVIYQNYVAPGAFVIQDLYPTSASGNLQVTITESDGSESTFIQPFAAVAIMQREGNFKYSLTAGRYRSSNSDSREPKFGQVTAIYGLPYGMTAYGGLVSADNYWSTVSGMGFGLGELGAVSLDVTYARSSLFNGTNKKGQSYRAQYSKGLQSTGTTFTLASYRYSTEGYYTFQEINELSNVNSRDLFWLSHNKRQKLQLDISQNILDYGSLYLSGSQQDYWGLDGSERFISSGYNVNYAGVNYGVSYTYSSAVADIPSDQRVAFNLQIPLSIWSSSTAYDSVWASYNVTTDKDGTILQQAGISGTALADNNLNYSVMQSYGNRNQGAAGNLAVNYRGSKGDINAGYNYDKDSYRLNYGIHGGVVAYQDGIVFGQTLGESIAIIHAPEADNVIIQNHVGVKTDTSGYAIVPYVNAYKSNRIALDTTTLGDNVDIDMQTQTVYPTKGAVVLTDFKTRIGQRVLMTLNYKGSPIPFGASVNYGKNNMFAIVGDNGQVYLTGLSEKGQLKVKWGKDPIKICIVDYLLPNKKPLSGVIEMTGTCL